ICFFFFFFFFSSRRRHTRSKRDWSSDVCSSDLSYNAILQSYLHYHYSPHLNYRSPLDIHLRHFLDTRHYFLLHFHFPDHHFPAGHFRCFLHSLLDFRHCFLLHFPHFLLLRSLRPLLVLLPVPVQVLVLHIVLAVLALVVCLLYKALNRWK